MKNIHFDLPTKVIKNLSHGINPIISCNDSLAEYIIKNKVSQLLSKHKHKNNFHDHRKQQFETNDKE